MPRARPIRPGRKPAKTTHVIHEDGSFTNKPVAVVALPEKKETAFEQFKKNIKLNTAIHLGGKIVGYVYCIYDHGVRIKPKRGVNPDLGSRPHVSWEMIKKDMEV